MNAGDASIHCIHAANASLLDRVDPDVFDQAVQPALLQAFLAEPSNLLVVAVIDGDVVGMASGIAYVHPDKPRQLFINEVGVSDRFQRRGLGRRLVAALLEEGARRGCHEAWVATEAGNTAARALYAALGGRQDEEPAIVYVYPLDPGPDAPGAAREQSPSVAIPGPEARVRTRVALLLLAAAGTAFGTLLAGADALGFVLPGGLPFGNALAALALCGVAGAARALAPAGSWRRRAAGVALCAALLWLPLSIALAGNAALNFGGGRGTAWVALSAGVLLLAFGTLTWSVLGAALARMRRA